MGQRTPRGPVQRPQLRGSHLVDAPSQTCPQHVLGTRLRHQDSRPVPGRRIRPDWHSPRSYQSARFACSCSSPPSAAPCGGIASREVIPSQSAKGGTGDQLGTPPPRRPLLPAPAVRETPNRASRSTRLSYLFIIVKHPPRPCRGDPHPIPSPALYARRPSASRLAGWHPFVKHLGV